MGKFDNSPRNIEFLPLLKPILKVGRRRRKFFAIEIKAAYSSERIERVELRNLCCERLPPVILIVQSSSLLFLSLHNPPRGGAHYVGECRHEFVVCSNGRMLKIILSGTGRAVNALAGRISLAPMSIKASDKHRDPQLPQYPIYFVLHGLSTD